MNEGLKRWAKSAALLPPAKRPVGLERQPVTTLITTSTLAVPTSTIRKIERISRPGHFILPEN